MGSDPLRNADKQSASAFWFRVLRAVVEINVLIVAVSPTTPVAETPVPLVVEIDTY